MDIMVNDDDMKGLSVFGHRTNVIQDNDEDMIFATPCDDHSSVHQSHHVSNRRDKNQNEIILNSYGMNTYNNHSSYG